jgi:RHH-type proline utilization regulon transcriptional repressor/proline dehydrogenase/delta 1-pyrroline-5-carboxylate dehydrogenase
LILEEEVYHDARFREALCDAVESLHVGSAWELPTKVNPLIHPPAGDLERALKELEPGESWAVMPRLRVDDNPQLVSPGVKWGVQPNSVTHCTEFFGPLLGVMPAKNLDEAIELVNATGYGLTSGLESLDDREQERWQQRIRAGNLYINRPTTGAIVLRQPFGGMGKSSFGPGIKAGGPNYVVPLMRFSDKADAATARSASEVDATPVDSSATPLPPNPPDVSRAEHLLGLREALSKKDHGEVLSKADAARLSEAINSYLHWMKEEFGQTIDPFRLVGEDNYRRYLPVMPVRIRVHADDSAFEIFARAAAARAAGCRSVISTPRGLSGLARQATELLDTSTDAWAAAIEFIEESDEELAAVVRSGVVQRLRYAAADRVPELIRRASAESYRYVADAPVLVHGRIELIWYFREQSLARVYHRYGNLGRRAEEQRAPVI